MKKMIAIMMTLALLISALAIPALAEETGTTVDQVTSATTQTGRGGHGNRQQMPGNGQMPQTPGQNNQNSQQPQLPGQNDQNSQNGQMPQMPGQNDQNTQNIQNIQMPGRGGKNNRQGKGAAGQNNLNGKAGRQLIFDQLLADGVITQEVYDAITAWINEKMPQAQQEAATPAEGTEPPALPEGAQDTNAEAKTELLKSLLDSGAITQEQYDLLNSGAPAAPAAPAEAPAEAPAT